MGGFFSSHRDNVPCNVKTIYDWYCPQTPCQGLDCRHGSSHQQRPSWFITNCNISEDGHTPSVYAGSLEDVGRGYVAEYSRSIALGPFWYETTGLHHHDGWRCPVPRFNIKMTSYQYRKSHCGNKMVVRSSYLHNGNSYTGKTSLYWIRALVWNMRQAISNRHADSSLIELWYESYHAKYIFRYSHYTGFESSREVANPLFPILLTGSSSHRYNVPYTLDYEDIIRFYRNYPPPDHLARLTL